MTAPEPVANPADSVAGHHDQALPFAPPRTIPAWKRGFDLMLVVLASPVVLLVASLVACWIRLVSPGPVLFRQIRIGKNGRSFTIYKFRSMHVQAHSRRHSIHVQRLIEADRPMTKLDRLGDSRLIRGGCLLRMLGLDELPQLLNVLRGEMSLVGPRPCLPNEFRCCGSEVLERFAVEPGLTGLWQVHRTERTTFRQMIEMDRRYVVRRSLWLDLSIIARTPLALARQLVGCCEARAALRHSKSRGARPARPQLYGGFTQTLD